MTTRDPTAASDHDRAEESDYFGIGPFENVDDARTLVVSAAAAYRNRLAKKERSVKDTSKEVSDRGTQTAANRQEFGARQRVLVEGYISSRVGQRVDAVEALLAERDRYREAIEVAMDALAVKGLPYQILHEALEPKP